MVSPSLVTLSFVFSLGSQKFIEFHFLCLHFYPLPFQLNLNLQTSEKLSVYRLNNIVAITIAMVFKEYQSSSPEPIF